MATQLMNPVQQLQRILRLAQRSGYTVRQECLSGASGGTCEIAGKRYLFVDLSLSPSEQLDQALESLAADRNFNAQTLQPELDRWNSRRKDAA